MRPTNRKERNLVGQKKGLRRSEAIVSAWGKTREEREKLVKLLALHHRSVTKRCSAFCCGNPRKFYGEKTQQEYRSDTDFKYELKETKERQ